MIGIGSTVGNYQVMKKLGSGYTAVRPDHFLGLIKGADQAGLIAPRLTDAAPPR